MDTDQIAECYKCHIIFNYMKRISDEVIKDEWYGDKHKGTCPCCGAKYYYLGPAQYSEDPYRYMEDKE